MGIETLKAIEDDPELALVGQTDLGDDLESAIRQTEADAVVDFTTASAAFSNCKTIIQASSRPVIGTSGLLPEQVSKLQELCEKHNNGGVIAPNFAVGAVLMMKYAQDAAKYFPNAEVIELHHDRKADAPSGTAIKTANLLAESRKSVPAKIDEKEILPGARGAESQDIRIHSVRLPGLVAHQEVIFGGQSQTCKKVMHLKELVYGLEHLL